MRGSALALAVLAPLVWLPGGFARFVLAKLFVTVLALLLAAWARPVGRLPRDVVVVGLVWVGVFAVAALLGDTPVASLLGRWPRYEGLPVLAVYAGAAWLGARVTGRGAGAAERLGVVVAALAIVLAAFSVLDALGVTPLGPTAAERSGSVLGNATDQGAAAMMAALVLAGRVVGGPVVGVGGRAAGVLIRRWLAGSHPGYSTTEGTSSHPGYSTTVVGLVAALATVAISGSRTALALTVLGLVVTCLGRLRAAAVAGGLLAAVALAVPTTRERLLGLGTAEGRVQQWRLTLDLVLDHPVLGLGGSRYVDAFLAYEDAAFVDFTGAQRIADSPHSIVLQVLVAGGLLLLAVTAVGVVVVGRRVWVALGEHPEARPAAVAVAAYLALACVNFTTAGPTCLAALLLGTVIAVPVPETRQVAHLPVAVASGALALVLAAAMIGEVRLQQGVDGVDGADGAAGFEQAQRWRPWDVDTRVIAARDLAEQAARGDLDAARRTEALAREALTRLPESYESLVALGVALSAQGRVAEAADVLDAAVAIAPERPDGYVQRGIARAGLGRVDDARADLLRAAEIVPRSPVVRRLLRQVERLPG